MDEPIKAKLGEQFMDILALALAAEPRRQSESERSVQLARLQSVKSYIEANLSNPNLSPAMIAKHNGISLRYLHHIFRSMDMTVSHWLRLRRLQRCRDMLTSSQYAGKSITEIAYSMGFSSSSHFSNLFRAEFSLTPSDARATRVRRK